MPWLHITPPEGKLEPVSTPSSFRIEGPRGEEINTLEDWHRYAPPKRPEIHWKRGRSAKESARAWLGDGTSATLPPEIARLLESHARTRGFQPALAIPEWVTRLDQYAGEHRNHDLIVVGDVGAVRTLVAIEAKADEPFGNHTVAGYLKLCAQHERDRLASAEAAQREGKRPPRPSNAARRIEELCAAVFGPAVDGSVAERAKPLRYQLVAALAGTLIEARARQCDQGVLVVHEFLSQPEPARSQAGTNERKVARNRAAWRSFSLAIIGDDRSAEECLAGPICVPGSERVPADIRCLLGKATRHLG